MARVQSFTTSGQPITAPPMTLDALMARQRDLQSNVPSADREMISPWQGAAYLGDVIANKVNQGRADADLAAARQQLAQTMSGIDWAGAGPTSEQAAQVGQYDPDLGLKMYQSLADLAAARRAREQELADFERQRSAGIEDYRTKLVIDKELNPAETFTTLTPEEEQAAGLAPEGTYQRSSTGGKISKIGGEGTTVNVGGNETSTAKKFGEKEGERLDAYIAAGNKAAGLRADMELLDVLGQSAPQGPLPGKLQKMFPGINSAGAAFNAVAKRLAPQMRVEGSGATSDIEYQGMVDSLPNLGNYPEANRLISAMMRAKSEIDLKRAEIATAWANDQMDLATARSQLNALNRQSIMSPELRSLIDAAQKASPGLGAADAAGGDLGGMSDEELDAEIARRRAAGER